MTSEELKASIGVAEAWGIGGGLVKGDFSRILEAAKLHLASLAADEQREREDAEPITDVWSFQEMGGSYKFDDEDEVEDCSFIGWSLSTADECGPSVAYYVEDGQLFLDGTGVPGVFLRTRGQLRTLLEALKGGGT